MSDNQSDNDVEWEECFGSTKKRVMEFEMGGGGSHAWKYVVHFDADGEQTHVYISRLRSHWSLSEEVGKRLLVDEEGNNVRLVDEDYDPQEDESFIVFA